MASQTVILVQIADRDWTLEALHCACRIARNTSGRVVLVKMISIAYWPGIRQRHGTFTPQDQIEFADYQATIEDYGVEFLPMPFHYTSLVRATAQVADYVGARIVFARIPQSVFPFWTTLQGWLLKRQLARQQ